MNLIPGKPFNPYMLFHGLFIPNSIAQSNFPDSAKILLGRLMQFAGQNGKAYPTRKRLMKELCWKEGKVNRNIRLLKDLKLIETATLNEDSATSPNEYLFVYQDMYSEPIIIPLVKNDNTPLVKNDNTPLVKNSKGGVIKNDRHNRRSKIDDKGNRKTFTNVKAAKAGGKKFNGLVCNVCGEDQFETTSGDSCINGHGGVEGIKKVKKKPILANLAKIGKIVKKEIPKGLSIYDYSPEAKQILQCWHENGGRLHVNGNTKGAPNIDFMITELLLEGRNPYIKLVAEDSPLRSRKWTIKEICDCIIHHAGVDLMNKDISNMYFDGFVVKRFKGYNGNNQRDHSILADTFEKIKSTTPHESELQQKLQASFEESYPSEKIWPKVTFKVASFLESKDDDYKKEVGRSLGSLFFNYIAGIVSTTGKTDQIKYMSTPENLDTFFKQQVKSGRVVKRTKEEKAKWLIEKPIQEKLKKEAIKKRDAKWAIEGIPKSYLERKLTF